MFDQWKEKVKEAAQKAAEQLNFDEMARNDAYMHQEGVNVVRKGEKKSEPRAARTEQTTSPLSSIDLRNGNNENLMIPTKTILSSAASMASSTRSTASMRQHSSFGSMQSDLEEAHFRDSNEDDSEEDEESENALRKNKLRFFQDLDHRLSKPNQELELLPQYTKATSSESTSSTTPWSSPSRNNKKQPLWAKPARSQSQVVQSTEDEAPLIVTTTTSSAVLDDSELQALAALQQQSSASSSIMPSFLISWCSASIPSLRQNPKLTGLVLLLVLFYLFRVYSRLVVPVEDGLSPEPA